MNSPSSTAHNFKSSDLYYVPPRHEDLWRYRNRFLTPTKEIVPFSTFNDCWEVSSAEDKKSLLEQYIDWTRVETVNESVVYVTYWPECYGHVFETFFHLHKYIEGDKECKVLLNIPDHFPNLIDLADHIFGDRLLNSSLFDQRRLYTFRDATIVPNFKGGNPDFHMWNDMALLGKIWSYYDKPSAPSYDRVMLTKTSKDSSDVLDNLTDIEGLLRDNGFIVINPQHESDSFLFNALKNARFIVLGNGSSLCPLVTLQNHSARIFIINARRYLPKWRQPCRTQHEVMQLVNETPQLALDDFEKSHWLPITSRFNTTYLDSFDNRITDEQLKELSSNIS